MKKLLNNSRFTKKELIIIGFLFICLAAGLVLKYSEWKKPEAYDYSKEDKEFDSRVKMSFTELEKNNLNNEQKFKSEEIKKFADSLITQTESTPKDKTLPPGKKININTAFAGDLQLLPGIGEVTAERIIDYREQKGGFKQLEEIKNVKGIGDKKFEQIKDYITVE